MPGPSHEFGFPIVLVVDDEAINRDFAETILIAAGWRVITVASGAAALDAMAVAPDLILMDLRMDAMGGTSTTAAIRRLAGLAGAMPILAYSTLAIDDPTTLHETGFDGYIRKPCEPGELAATAADWLPAEAATLRRLRKTFGIEQIMGMTGRLGTLLVQALAALDRNEATAIAHRVAGVAGTLGFTDAGSAWLRLSEGDMLAADDIRRHSRRVLAALSHPFH